MVPVRRAWQKARRVIWKDLCERVRHIICEHVFLDAIPYIEQKPPARLEDPLGLAVARLTVRKEHDTELTKNDIECTIFEWQRLRIDFSPVYTSICDLSCRCIV